MKSKRFDKIIERILDDTENFDTMDKSDVIVQLLENCEKYVTLNNYFKINWIARILFNGILTDEEMKIFDKTVEEIKMQHLIFYKTDEEMKTFDKTDEEMKTFDENDFIILKDNDYLDDDLVNELLNNNEHNKLFTKDVLDKLLSEK